MLKGFGASETGGEAEGGGTAWPGDEKPGSGGGV